MKSAAILFAIFGTSTLLMGQGSPAVRNPLLRQYQSGEALTYHMEGINDAWHYSLDLVGVVKKDPAGPWFEEYRCANMQSDGQPFVLPPASVDLRQEVSLDPNRNPTMPNLSQVNPKLIGPITDFMTFYVDLWLVAKTGQLVHPGDHFFMANGTPNSWADGTYVTTGVSAIDFDLTFKSINTADNTALLLVRHLPPDKSKIPLRAEWMHTPVAGTTNNWVELKKEKGKYLAAVGKETFYVEMKISLADGKILSATMDNPVQAIQRECEDEALTKCGAPTPLLIHRNITISLTH